MRETYIRYVVAGALFFSLACDRFGIVSQNVGPVGVAIDAQPKPPLSVIFTGSAEDGDHGKIVRWVWSLGDGTPDQDLGPTPFEYKYREKNVFVIRACVASSSSRKRP